MLRSNSLYSLIPRPADLCVTCRMEKQQKKFCLVWGFLKEFLKKMKHWDPGRILNFGVLIASQTCSYQTEPLELWRWSMIHIYRPNLMDLCRIATKYFFVHQKNHHRWPKTLLLPSLHFARRSRVVLFSPFSGLSGELGTSPLSPPPVTPSVSSAPTPSLSVLQYNTNITHIIITSCMQERIRMAARVRACNYNRSP